MPFYWDTIAGAYEKFMSPAAWIERQLAIIEGLSGRVLEACCGTGQLLVAMLQRGIDAQGIDLSPKMVQRGAPKAGRGRVRSPTRGARRC